jgi:predicted CoA-substrate-specific enzyme activase
MPAAGLDVGSLWTKAVVVRDGALAAWNAVATGGDTRRTAEELLRRTVADAGLSSDVLPPLVVTGAGREEIQLPGEKATEVLCAARGARFLHPAVRAVIDMGGESTRVVRLDERGEVLEFVLNDKCAAGTGVFLDAMGKVMGVPVEQMGPLSLCSTAYVNITSMCVAFAESEVVSQVHRQTPKQDILRGIHKSIASRVYSVARRLDLTGEKLLAGGMARNVGIVRVLEELMKEKLIVPEQPHIVTALGAAALAAARS